MEWTLPNDWIEFVDCLNANGVDYLVVGAFALAFHRLPRTTGDIDFWIDPTPENAERAVKALDDFGFGSLGVTANDLAKKDMILQMGYPPGRIDLMTSIDGVGFDDAWNHRVQGRLGGKEVNFLGREQLLRNKLATGRAKDQADAQDLQKQIERERMTREKP